MKPKVLIVDDELDIQSSLSFALQDENFEVFTASSPAEAKEILSKQDVDVGLYDVWFPVGDGLELLEYTRDLRPDMFIVMMSGHGNIELALKSIRKGAYDFLEKPLELEKVLVVLRNGMEAHQLRKENRRLRELSIQIPDLCAHSAPMKQLASQIQAAAQSQSHVFIQGEIGSGKEVVARALHRLSQRSKEPFVVVKCSELSGPTFEQALFGVEKGILGAHSQRQEGKLGRVAQGTLYFDEIADLSLEAQGRLLALFESKSYHRVGGAFPIPLEARIIVSTHKDISALVKTGQFREDLLYKIRVLPLTVPALRDRTEDLKALSLEFLEIFSREQKHAMPNLGEDLIHWFETYDWPGNVRELKNLVERMCLWNPSTATLTVKHLPEEFQSLLLPPKKITEGSTGSLRDLRASFEAELIRTRLEQNQGNVSRTAESLDIERTHLYRKMKQYGIDVNEVHA